MNITVKMGVEIMTREESVNYIKSLLPEARDLMVKRIKSEVPPRGKFQGISVSFWLKDTENTAMLIYKYDVIGDGSSRRLSLGVRRNNSAYNITSQIFKGTNEETLEFLNFSDEQINDFTKQILELAEDADERDERFMK